MAQFQVDGSASDRLQLLGHGLDHGPCRRGRRAFPRCSTRPWSGPPSPQSRRVHPRTVATSVPSGPASQSTLIGNCQQTDGFQSMGDSPASSAARCSAQPAPPLKPGRLRKMQAPSTTRVPARLASLKMPAGRSLGVVLEALGHQGRGQRADLAGLILAVEVGADRAAAVAEMLGRLGQDAQAAAPPDAGPVETGGRLDRIARACRRRRSPPSPRLERRTGGEVAAVRAGSSGGSRLDLGRLRRSWTT